MPPRPSLCATCLAFLLKLLNFLQAFVGVSVVIYSAWVLNHWYKHHDSLGAGLAGLDLPHPWFAYALLGIGVLVCLIALTGHVAAEAVNGCCLCFYTILATTFILLEAALVGFFLLDKHWKEDLPNDPTGALESLRAFFEDNADIFKWVGLTVVVIQALSLLLAIILRAMVSPRRADYDSDDDFTVIRQPLINPPYGPNPTMAAIDGKGMHSDIWSSRMRQKYGLSQSDFSSNGVDPKASPSTNTR